MIVKWISIVISLGVLIWYTAKVGTQHTNIKSDDDSFEMPVIVKDSEDEDEDEV